MKISYTRRPGCVVSFSHTVSFLLYCAGYSSCRIPGRAIVWMASVGFLGLHFCPMSSLNWIHEGGDAHLTDLQVFFLFFLWCPLQLFRGFPCTQHSSQIQTDIGYLSTKDTLHCCETLRPLKENRWNTVSMHHFDKLVINTHHNIPRLEWCQAMVFFKIWKAIGKMGTACRSQLGEFWLANIQAIPKYYFIDRTHRTRLLRAVFFLVEFQWYLWPHQSVGPCDIWAWWLKLEWLVDLKPTMRSSSGRLVNDVTLIQ